MSANKKAYIVGGYGLAGASYMSYYIAKVLHTHFGYECIILTVGKETPEHGLFNYPISFDYMPIEELDQVITDKDLLVSNPRNSERFFGARLPGKKLMYAQATVTFKILDGFFDGYVSVSKYVQNYLYQVYGIKAPIIPPFTHPDKVPTDLPTWESRPKNEILVMGKKHFAELEALFHKTMQEKYPELDFTLNKIPRFSKSQESLLNLMAQHRYFLQFSPIEGFGLTPLEAMACGCTTLGFHGFGGLDYMRPNYNCATVAYPNMEELCDNVATMLMQPKKAQKLAKRGTSLIHKYTLDRYEKQWIKYLRKFLA